MKPFWNAFRKPSKKSNNSLPKPRPVHGYRPIDDNGASPPGTIRGSIDSSKGRATLIRRVARGCRPVDSPMRKGNLHNSPSRRWDAIRRAARGYRPTDDDDTPPPGTKQIRAGAAARRRRKLGGTRRTFP